MGCTRDTKRLTGHVLLSAPAVPVGLTSSSSAQNQSAVSGSGTQNIGASAAETRLTTLLGLSTSPTRASLLSSTLAAGVLKLAPKPIQRLYEVLEVPFDPLALCGEVAPILAELAAHEGKQGEWAPYVAALQRAVLSRLMSQLAQVYASVRIAFVLELVAPLRTEASSEQKQDVTPQAAVHFFDPEQVESYMMGCARRGELAVRVDHAEGSIAFVDEAFGGVLEGSTFASSSSSSSAGADAAIQPSTTELVRTRLGSVARTTRSSKTPPSRALTTAVHAERRALVARRRELLSELVVCKKKEDAVWRAEATRRTKDEADKPAGGEGGAEGEAAQEALAALGVGVGNAAVRVLSEATGKCSAGAAGM
ncbi:hypothetical protein B0H14DRAFT_3728981 [Mycena olivaceomarginata]|nr:hypothetical protein B0H14DRAFT_3728981 [Mycena olivaceomarginata]